MAFYVQIFKLPKIISLFRRPGCTLKNPHWEIFRFSIVLQGFIFSWSVCTKSFGFIMRLQEHLRACSEGCCILCSVLASGVLFLTTFQHFYEPNATL
jgi:hypothetical protein